jgi:radical SAM protein with 4Fe4S-binding SPASM domain
MVVYYDGKVALCNHDWNTQLKLGDLNHQTITNVWTGEAYQKVRRLPRSQVASCQDCCFESGHVYGEILDGG